MRKSIVVFIVMVLGLSAGAYMYLYKPYAPAPSIEALLPGDTLVMHRICDLNKQIEQAKNGKLGKALAEIDWLKLMDLVETPVTIKNLIVEKWQEVEKTVNSPLFDSILGKDMTLAILDTEIDPDLLDAGEYQGLLDAVVLIAKPKHPAAIIDNLTSVFDTKLGKETHPYKEWTIVKLSMDPEVSLYYALNEDLMIAGLSAVPVQRCLDQIGFVDTSLAENPYFKTHGGDLFVDGKTDSQSYVNMEKALSKITAIADMKAEIDPSMIALKAQMENMQGIESFNSVAYDDGSPVLHSKIILGIDKERLSSTIKSAVRVSPSKNPTLARTPENVLLYSWQNNFDLMDIWNEVAENPDIEKEDLELIKQAFVLQTGMELETFSSLFGKQFGFVLGDIKQGPAFPVPFLALILEIEKPDEANRLITDMAAKFKIHLTQDTHNGVDIQQVPLPLGETLSPTFTLSDGFLTVAINRPFLERILDTTTSNSISTNANFVTLGSDFTGENNQMFFAQTEEIFVKSKELITWGMTMMAITKPVEAQKLMEIIDVGVYPILDGLTMIKSIGVNWKNKEDSVVCEMKGLIDRG